jgi:hypothetical protein
VLLRVCRNFLKHTIYYGKSELLTRENDVWMWFAIGIFYHVGGEQHQHCEEIIFWSLDILMNNFGDLSRGAFLSNIGKIIELSKDYFPKWHAKLVHSQARRSTATTSTSSPSYTSGPTR